MKIAFDINEDSISGWEWRMWKILGNKRELKSHSLTLYKNRDDCIKDMVEIAEGMKHGEILIFTEPATIGEIKQPEEVKKLFPEKQIPVRKDIDG